MKVESGFHRYIGYYSALPEILRKARIRLNDIFTWEEKVEIRVKDEDRLVTLGLAPLYGPLKTIRGILGNNDVISPFDKASLIPFFLKGLNDFVRKPKELDTYSLRDYAKKYKVSDRAFHHVLVPLSTGLYFLPPERYSAYVFFGLFAPGVPKFYKLRIGAFLGGMTEVMCQPMADFIEKRNGIVKTAHKVKELQMDDHKITGVKMDDGRIYKGKHIALATTLHSAKQLLAPKFGDHPWFQDMLKLPTMPAATFQLELIKPSLPKDITTFGPKTSMISFAEQSRTTFRHATGRLSIILSNPEKFLTMTPEDTLQIVLQDARKLGIDLMEEDVIDYRQVNHHYDFHSLEPGYNWMRPEQNTPVEGLVLGGDYTMQPYFATMEGAVVSGQKAAQVILKNKTAAT